MDDAGDLPALADRLGRVQYRLGRLPAHRTAHVVLRRDHLQAWRRRTFDAIRAADDLPDAVLHRRLLAVDQYARQRIYDRVPGAGDADDRRLRGARSVAVLFVLRRRPDPDVPDHRHLGRQAARLRRLQVLPLHAARLAPDVVG